MAGGLRSPRSRAGTGLVVRSHLTLRERLDEFIWLRLARVPGLALRPERLLLGLVTVVLMLAALAVIDSIAGASGASGSAVVGDVARTATLGLWGDLRALDAASLFQRLRHLVVGVPTEALGRAPVSSLLSLLVIGLIWCFGAGAIARSAAVEIGLLRRIGLLASVVFAVRRLVHAAIGFVIIGLCAAVPLGLAAGVFRIGFAVPLLDGLSGVLYAVAVLGGVLAVVGLLLAVLAVPLLPGTSACQGGDGFDLAQRVVAYGLQRPAAIAVAAIALGAAGLVIGSVVWGVTQLGVELAAWATGAPSGIGADASAAGRFVEMWERAPLGVAAAFAVSYTACAGSALYLVLRESCDDQGPGSIAEA